VIKWNVEVGGVGTTRSVHVAYEYHIIQMNYL